MKKQPLMRLVILLVMIPGLRGGCIEEERKALLEIKASLKSYGGDADRLLPTWRWSDEGGGCCDWERVKCNGSSGHVTDLGLEGLRGIVYEDYSRKIWQLNVSVFLHFKELRNLNLASDFLDDGIQNTELAALENLEMLDLTYGGGFYGTFEMQGLERLSGLRKLEILNLGYNNFNESIFPSLSAFPLLKVLNLGGNAFSGSFPAKELANLNSLERLDLSENYLNDTSTIHDCMKLASLKTLESIALGGNMFNKSIISCLSDLPSLKILDLRQSTQLGNSFPFQELLTLKELATLDMSSSSLDSLESNGTMNSLLHLNLDGNNFRKEVLRSFVAFPSLKFLSLANGYMEGMISTEDLPKLPDLEVLVLRNNWFNGTLPMKAIVLFSS